MQAILEMCLPCADRKSGCFGTRGKLLLAQGIRFERGLKESTVAYRTMDEHTDSTTIYPLENGALMCPKMRDHF